MGLAAHRLWWWRGRVLRVLLWLARGAGGGLCGRRWFWCVCVDGRFGCSGLSGLPRSAVGDIVGGCVLGLVSALASLWGVGLAGCLALVVARCRACLPGCYLGFGCFSGGWAGAGTQDRRLQVAAWKIPCYYSWELGSSPGGPQSCFILFQIEDGRRGAWLCTC